MGTDFAGRRRKEKMMRRLSITNCNQYKDASINELPNYKEKAYFYTTTTTINLFLANPLDTL